MYAVFHHPFAEVDDQTQLQAGQTQVSERLGFEKRVIMGCPLCTQRLGSIRNGALCDRDNVSEAVDAVIRNGKDNSIPL